MTKANLSRADVEERINLLDLASRDAEEQWRKPLLDLWEDLEGKRRIRRWVLLLLAGLCVSAPAILEPSSIFNWMTAAIGAFTICLFGVQVALESLFPTIDRESRIVAFWTYYLSWRDDDPEREAHNDTA